MAALARTEKCARGVERNEAHCAPATGIGAASAVVVEAASARAVDYQLAGCLVERSGKSCGSGEGPAGGSVGNGGPGSRGRGEKGARGRGRSFGLGAVVNAQNVVRDGRNRDFTSFWSCGGDGWARVGCACGHGDSERKRKDGGSQKKHRSDEKGKK